MKLVIEQNVELAPMTTYHVGGLARYFARATNLEEVLELRAFAKENMCPFYLLGGGSNILFPDEGYEGLVILNEMKQVEVFENEIKAGSGIFLSELILNSAKEELGGGALASIPGTLGGAIYGNAGVPEICIGDLVESVSFLPEDSDISITLNHEECAFGYRTSGFKKMKGIILSVLLKKQHTPEMITKGEAKKWIKIPQEKQPVGYSCGSFFKNPKDLPSAGWIIEQSGCKGLKIGDAIVSEKHANFFINQGHATSNDLRALATEVQQRVKAKFNVDLEPEVQIITN